MKKKSIKSMLFLITGLACITLSSGFVEPDGSQPKFKSNVKLKTESVRCSTTPINFTVDGWFNVTTSTAGVSYSLGTGPATNYSQNCGEGGTLLVCQLIDCTGKNVGYVYKG